MDTQKEYEVIIRLLDNAEGWENISDDFRKIIQERFQLLFTVVELQQQAIQEFLTEFNYEYGWQKTNVENNKRSQWHKGALRGFEHSKEIFDKHFK